MKRFIHIIIMLAVATSAQAQVIQSINKQNMKFENRDKPEPVKEKPAIDYSIVIDTTTLYFALIDSAQHHINLKQWAVAERFLLDAIKAEPGNPSNSLLLSNLATMQRRQGKLAEAIKNYSMAIDLTPNAVTLLHNRAALYTVVDSIARAQADYERIMELDPDDPYIYVLRAKLNKLRFNRSDMERDIKLAVAHGLDEKEVKQLLGE